MDRLSQSDLIPRKLVGQIFKRLLDVESIEAHFAGICDLSWQEHYDGWLLTIHAETQQLLWARYARLREVATSCNVLHEFSVEFKSLKDRDACYAVFSDVINLYPTKADLMGHGYIYCSEQGARELVKFNEKLPRYMGVKLDYEITVNVTCSWLRGLPGQEPITDSHKWEIIRKGGSFENPSRMNGSNTGN